MACSKHASYTTDNSVGYASTFAIFRHHFWLLHNVVCESLAVLCSMVHLLSVLVKAIVF